MFWGKKRNSQFTSKQTIINQMNELRPLPLGRTEFNEWSDRIISGALLEADHGSQKFALADMLLHLKPTEDHCQDAYFIKSLRKHAINQVADTIRKELHAEAKERLKKQEEENKLKLVDKPGEVMPQPQSIDEPKVLADSKV